MTSKDIDGGNDSDKHNRYLPQIDCLFENGMFCQPKWEAYINSVYENSAHVFTDDLKECLDSGCYEYERDVLPVLNAVCNHPESETMHASFCNVTEGLNDKVTECFGHELNIDIVLYVGLCNGAGWVINLNGRDVILLGIEKILELNWCEKHFLQIMADFHQDLPTMTKSNQRYFGDWVSYHGKGDVGYYLGTKFVQQLCGNYDFDRVINLDMESVYREYLLFAEFG